MPARGLAVSSITPEGLRAGVLGRAFDATAASYKFFWFLALLRRLPHAQELAVRDLVAEMVVLAWAPAALYRLSFGWHDRLADTVRELAAAKALPPGASEAQIRRALAQWADGPARLEALAQLVPTRFLGPWLDTGLAPAIRDARRTRRIVALAQETLDRDGGPPYAIVRRVTGLVIVFGSGWRPWLLENSTVLRGHALFALVGFLQARNPHVPGIVDKVQRPGTRKLAGARRLFEVFRRDEGGLYEPYPPAPRGSDDAVAHGRPRAGVAQDLRGPRAPAAVVTNRAKGDALPNRSLIAPFATFHHSLIRTPGARGHELEDYVSAFGLSLDELRALSPDLFVQRYDALMTPLLLIATQQGFRPAWVPGRRT